jgi:hypothetical protein
MSSSWNTIAHKPTIHSKSWLRCTPVMNFRSGTKGDAAWPTVLTCSREDWTQFTIEPQTAGCSSMLITHLQKRSAHIHLQDADIPLFRPVFDVMRRASLEQPGIYTSRVDVDRLANEQQQRPNRTTIRTKYETTCQESKNTYSIDNCGLITG